MTASAWFAVCCRPSTSNDPGKNTEQELVMLARRPKLGPLKTAATHPRPQPAIQTLLAFAVSQHVIDNASLSLKLPMSRFPLGTPRQFVLGVTGLQYHIASGVCGCQCKQRLCTGAGPLSKSSVHYVYRATSRRRAAVGHMFDARCWCPRQLLSRLFLMVVSSRYLYVLPATKTGNYLFSSNRAPGYASNGETH
jgi:hypothetical protein